MSKDEHHNPTFRKNDRLLVLFLRLVGVADLLAILVVFFPGEWIAWAHEWIGLGDLPQERIVGYLARSTSLLYGIHGAILLVMASDIVHYRSLVCWYGRVLTVAGVLLAGVDIAESMPFWWTVFEGTVVAGIGVVILTLCHDRPATDTSLNSHSS